MKRQRAMIGIRLNYGMQAFYRDRGIEPCCGMCFYFGTADPDPATGRRFCVKQQYDVEAGEVCYAPERAPGADDE